MKIREEHLYHGAALNQIAENKKFTAINSLSVKGKVSRSAFRINDKTAVYLKYAAKPAGRFKEYQFTFRAPHRAELKNIADSGEDLYIALVCVMVREICCITYKQFATLLQARRNDAGKAESQFVILVTALPNQAFRVYVNAYKTRGKNLGIRKVSRNRFPNTVLK